MPACGISLANMYGLFLFGPRVERSMGTKKFTWFYLLCGSAASCSRCCSFAAGTLIGSSAAVFGVMTAYAMQWPDDEMYLVFVLPMRARTLVVGLFGLQPGAGHPGTGDGRR